MLDVVLLRLMKYRKDFNHLYGLVNGSSALDPQTKTLLGDFRKYFESYPSHDRVDFETFHPRFKAWHPNLNQEQMVSWTSVIKNTILTDADDDQKKNIVEWVANLELATKLGNIAENFNNGDLPDVFAATSEATDNWRRRTGFKFDSYIDIPIGELLQEEFDDSGLRWRLGCLNESMRPLRAGDFGIIAGRPDKGKTSFISSEITYMAGQLPKDRCILWLNNEGPGKRIIPSLYRSALNMNMNDLKTAHAAGTLEESYIKAVGRRDKIKIVDIHGMTNGQVEMIIEDHEPAIIVYDMIDNIKGFGDAARTDLALEQMYQWARERSVKYDAIGLATSQISNDGDGQQYPTLGMLKDSKTGKQGACDFQLMIGSVNQDGMQLARFVSLPKNKLRRPDGPADPRREVIFDALRARYRDVEVGPPTIKPEGPESGTADASALQELTA